MAGSIRRTAEGDGDLMELNFGFVAENALEGTFR